MTAGEAGGARSPGPRVVGLGGGHGLAASLLAIRRYAGEITAVVSVADDGGSSGRLRDALGIPAPGDLRRCLVALAAEGAPTPWAEAFEHRFEAGELAGHALGNLILAGLTAVTGDFGTALAEAGLLLGAVGRVIPATVEPVVLKAMAGGREVEGQVAVDLAAGLVSSVSLVPADAHAPRAALEAIASADQIVIGPGSLFSSLIAVVAVPDIRRALEASKARKVYVANLRESADSPRLDVAAHVSALRDHGVSPDVVVADPQSMAVGDVGVEVVTAALAGPDGLTHDPEALAAILVSLVR